LASLAGQQAEYTKKNYPEVTVISKPCVWGTKGEIRWAVDRIDQYLFTTRYTGEVRVIVSTNKGHLHRVKLWWNHCAPKEWKVIFKDAPHSFTLKEYFQEAVKFVRDWREIRRLQKFQVEKIPYRAVA
jgi:hypothetical protein